MWWWGRNSYWQKQCYSSECLQLLQLLLKTHWVKYGETLNIALIFQGAFEYDFHVSSLKQCVHWIYVKCLDTYLVFHFKNTFIFVSHLFCENCLKIVILFQVILWVCHSFMSVFMCNHDHWSHEVLLWWKVNYIS